MDPSTEDILINVTPFETRVALVCQGAAQELHLERNISLGQVGSIRLGKVARVLPGMQSAFVDIGLERAAFIHIADVQKDNYGVTKYAGTLIRMQAILTSVHRTCMAKRYDQSTLQYNYEDTRLQERRKFKETSCTRTRGENNGLPSYSINFRKVQVDWNT